MTQLQAAVADLVVVKVEDDGRERYAGERQRRPGAALAAVSSGSAPYQRAQRRLWESDGRVGVHHGEYGAGKSSAGRRTP